MITRTCISKAEWSDENIDVEPFDVPNAVANLVRLLSTYYVIEEEPSDICISIVCDEGDAKLVCTFTGTVLEMAKLFMFASKFREISESAPLVVGVVPGMTAFDHQIDVMRSRHNTSCAVLVSLLPKDDYTRFSLHDLIERYLAL